MGWNFLRKSKSGFRNTIQILHLFGGIKFLLVESKNGSWTIKSTLWMDSSDQIQVRIFEIHHLSVFFWNKTREKCFWQAVFHAKMVHNSCRPSPSNWIVRSRHYRQSKKGRSLCKFHARKLREKGTSYRNLTELSYSNNLSERNTLESCLFNNNNNKNNSCDLYLHDYNNINKELQKRRKYDNTVI